MLTNLNKITKKIIINFFLNCLKDIKYMIINLPFDFFVGTIFFGSLFYSLHIYYYFNPFDIDFQFVYRLFIIKNYNIEFIFGIDGISLCFLLLTVFIMPLCWFASCTIIKNNKEFVMYLILIHLFLILSFTMLDLFFFYVFFESVLIPMFLIIGLWGSRARKIRAAYYLFLYTLFGSLFMLAGILYIYTVTGTTDLTILLDTKFSANQQIGLWICFFLPFAIKIPMFPFHIWLPEAHVEAPTIGSIILASLLLKLGSYGLLRFTLPLFPLGSEYYNPLVYSMALASVLYASLITIRQIDLKRVIAYSSVAHMNLIVLGLFTYTKEGIDGAIYLMIGHGIVSSALFFCVGILYDRHRTRTLRYYGGLAQVMPIYSIYFFIFTMANMGFPGTSNFIGELLILIGLFEKNSIIMVLAASGIVFSAIYSIWLYNRLMFGALKLKHLTEKNFKDLTFLEGYILFILSVQMFALGLHSEIVLELTDLPVTLILIGVV